MGSPKSKIEQPMPAFTGGEDASLTHHYHVELGGLQFNHCGGKFIPDPLCAAKLHLIASYANKKVHLSCLWQYLLRAIKPADMSHLLAMIAWLNV